jgi:hypothetical protein
VRTSITARGLTDIRGPLQAAMAVLSAGPQVQTQPGLPALPFIFLVTDGCVQVGSGKRGRDEDRNTRGQETRSWVGAKGGRGLRTH